MSRVEASSPDGAEASSLDKRDSNAATMSWCVYQATNAEVRLNTNSLSIQDYERIFKHHAGGLPPGELHYIRENRVRRRGAPVSDPYLPDSMIHLESQQIAALLSLRIEEEYAQRVRDIKEKNAMLLRELQQAKKEAWEWKNKAQFNADINLKMRAEYLESVVASANVRANEAEAALHRYVETHTAKMVEQMAATIADLKEKLKRAENRERIAIAQRNELQQPKTVWDDYKPTKAECKEYYQTIRMALECESDEINYY